MTIHAVFRNGVFYPIGNVPIPENSHVELEARVVPQVEQATLDAIYATLGKSYPTSEPNLSDKHNDHQP